MKGNFGIIVLNIIMLDFFNIWNLQFWNFFLLLKKHLEVKRRWRRKRIVSDWHCEDGSPTVSCMKKIVCGYGGLWKFGTKRGLSQNSTLFFSYFSTKLATCFDFLFLFILTNLVRVHVRRCQKLWLGETTNCIPLYKWCQNWTVCWDCRKM